MPLKEILAFNNSICWANYKFRNALIPYSFCLAYFFPRLKNSSPLISTVASELFAYAKSFVQALPVIIMNSKWRNILVQLWSFYFMFLLCTPNYFAQFLVKYNLSKKRTLQIIFPVESTKKWKGNNNVFLLFYSSVGELWSLKSNY